MLLLGIDIGTSSIKVAIVDAHSQQTITTVQYPETETPIVALQSGWAEQSPETWWQHVQSAILAAHAQQLYNPADIKAIGIAYQMHGLVCVDKDQQVLRDSIIWCDSRAVPFGNKAFEAMGTDKCLSHLLNSPGNFTAAKLAWVKENEPAIFDKIDKILLPGDFIAMKLTGSCTTSISALSEGVFWDFANNELSKDVFNLNSNVNLSSIDAQISKLQKSLDLYTSEIRRGYTKEQHILKVNKVIDTSKVAYNHLTLLTTLTLLTPPSNLNFNKTNCDKINELFSENTLSNSYISSDLNIVFNFHIESLLKTLTILTTF